MRVSKKDIGCVCVVNWLDAEPETGLIVSTKYGIQVYIFDRCVLEKVQSGQISNISKCRLTSTDVEEFLLLRVW